MSNLIFKRKNKQKGFTLVELTLSIAAIVFMIAGAIKLLGPILAQNRAKDEIVELTKIFAAVQAKWANNPNYDGIDIEQLINNGVFPASWVNNGQAVNRWGGVIEVQATQAFTASDSFELTTPNIPSEECKTIVPGLFGTVRGMEVGGTEIKAIDGTTQNINMADVGTSCGENTTVEIKYAIGR